MNREDDLVFCMDKQKFFSVDFQNCYFGHISNNIHPMGCLFHVQSHTYVLALSLLCSVQYHYHMGPHYNETPSYFYLH